MKKWILMLFICFLAAICSSAFGMDYTDVSDNQHEYGKKVAALVSLQKNAGSRKKAAEGVIVLVKTDGTEPDFVATGAEQCLAGPRHHYTLFFKDSDTAETAVAHLNQNQHILYAEKDSELSACDTAEIYETGFHSYGASNMGFQPLVSWARNIGKGSTVAIIDSGIGSHPDLVSRVTKGWDYVDNDDDPSNDESGHGTHVAGIVADCTQGAAVYLYAIRILNSEGKGTVSNALNAVLEAAEAKIPVINLSFEGTTESEALDEAILAARDEGCTVVIAAGNSGIDTVNVCPGHLTEKGVIVVGAADENGDRASYSNYGASVDCYAYGSNIQSCQPGGGYVAGTGTSQAAPHISAACALLKIIYGGSPASLESRIIQMKNDGETIIPQLDARVPRIIPCHLTGIHLGIGEQLTLPVQALPLLSGEKITWQSSDPEVFTVNENGQITAVGIGNAELIRNCSNYTETRISVRISAEKAGRYYLPDALKELEGEALAGIRAGFLIAGQESQIEKIGPDNLGADLVLLCPSGRIADYAEENEYPYIVND